MAGTKLSGVTRSYIAVMLIVCLGLSQVMAESRCTITCGICTKGLRVKRGCGPEFSEKPTCNQCVEDAKRKCQSGGWSCHACLDVCPLPSTNLTVA